VYMHSSCNGSVEMIVGVNDDDDDYDEFCVDLVGCVSCSQIQLRK